MNIEQIKQIPIGQENRFGGGITLAIKTKKECKEFKKNLWIHKVLLSDGADDILADVNVGPRYNPLTSPDITIIVAWLKDSDHLNKPIKMLYIDQFRINSQTEPDFDADWKAPDWDAINRGKVRHGLVCAYIRAGKTIDKTEIGKLVEYIMNGQLSAEEKKRREQIVRETGENDPRK